MHFEIIFLTLFSVATAVALLARWLRVPYTVALVAAGLGLGAVRFFQPPHLTRELMYSVFLPGLLFEAAFHLKFRTFWENKVAILSLAVPGVVISIALTATLLAPAVGLLGISAGFLPVHAMLFAAVVAATDPIAVVALFRHLRAPRRLAVLVEGESLLNDGTSLVFFTFVLSLVAGHKTSPLSTVLSFAAVIGGGMLLGATVGFLVSQIIRRIDDPMIEITMTTIAAYASFAVAEHLGGSGVIATVAAGMLCGNYAAGTGMSPATLVAVESFWEYLSFALNSTVFLLIGFTVRLSSFLSSWRAILVGYLVVTVVRAAVISLLSLLLYRTRERIPWRWSGVLIWGGLRGGLSMVMVLSLPAEFPHRELLTTMTSGVVVLTILCQGLTMTPLLSALGIQRENP